MDKTVILLIGAGVCCVVIGIALFAKLCATKSNANDESGSSKLLDDEYAENFKDCFESTGNIEETLEQLAHIYTGNQYMYNLIINALDYIREEQGDYETALDGINVDDDKEVMRLHNMAMRKSLHLEHKEHINEDDEDNKKITESEEVFDEDFDEDEEEVYIEKPAKPVKPKPEKQKQTKEFVEYGSEYDEDDDEDLKI